MQPSFGVVKHPVRIYRPSLLRAKYISRRNNQTPNAPQVRAVVASALRAYGKPMSIDMIYRALKEVCQFKIRKEYVLMGLMCKQLESGIRYTGKLGSLEFGLADWEEKVH